MNFRRSLLIAGAILGTVFSNSANATSVVISVQAYIDDNSSLIVQGNTLQWTNNVGTGGGVYAAPGRWGGYNYPTVISTSLNGSPVLTSYNWVPTWPTNPPDEVRYVASSSVFTSLDPSVGNLPLVNFSWTGRDYGTLVQSPGAANNYTTIFNFWDPAGGPAWYTATLTYSSVPELSTWAMMLAGFAGLGLAGYRKSRLAKV